MFVHCSLGAASGEQQLCRALRDKQNPSESLPRKEGVDNWKSIKLEFCRTGLGQDQVLKLPGLKDTVLSTKSAQRCSGGENTPLLQCELCGSSLLGDHMRRGSFKGSQQAFNPEVFRGCQLFSCAATCKSWADQFCLADRSLHPCIASRSGHSQILAGVEQLLPLPVPCKACLPNTRLLGVAGVFAKFCAPQTPLPTETLCSAGLRCKWKAGRKFTWPWISMGPN